VFCRPQNTTCNPKTNQKCTSLLLKGGKICSETIADTAVAAAVWISYGLSYYYAVAVAVPVALALVMARAITAAS